MAVALPSPQGIISAPADIIMMKGETSDGREYYKIRSTADARMSQYDYYDYNDYDDYQDYNAGFANARPLNGFF